MFAPRSDGSDAERTPSLTASGAPTSAQRSCQRCGSVERFATGVLSHPLPGTAGD